ncbi:hypothetical protein [Clostridium sp. ZBS17]|uniref:hypothetical protein n=1 Tax=Clostridium sp. ZBS17 TaxID=2949968 RepID=UPI0020792D8A|nr:hypothetical protein [Clostridium sp. ZBS17]
MKNWDKEIEKAKEEVIEAKKLNWLLEYRSKNSIEGTIDHVKTIVKVPDFEVKAWFISKWNTGFIVCDLEELMKRPKRERDKVLKLGGIS